MSPGATATDGARRSAAGGGPGARWMLPLFLVAACAGPSRGHVGEFMTAVAHERAAEVEERRALQAGQVTAGSGTTLSGQATDHRQSAELLRRAAAEACPAPAMDSEGVFSLVTANVLEVRPIQERAYQGPPRPMRDGPPPRLAGVLLLVSTRLPAEDVAAGVRCQVARARVDGGIPTDPASVAGVSLHVRSKAAGSIEIELHADDFAAAAELLRRAQALAAH